MTEVEWHPIKFVEYEGEDGQIEGRWEGVLPDLYAPVMVTSALGEVGVDELIDDWGDVLFDSLVCEVIAWAALPDPYKKPEPLDMHPDAIAARRYMENHR